MRLSRESGTMQKRIESLREDQKKLHAELDGYRKGGQKYDDVLNSGFIRPGDRMFFFRGGEPERGKAPDQEKAPEDFTFELSHMRIVWIIVSILVVLFYISRRSRSPEEKVMDIHNEPRH